MVEERCICCGEIVPEGRQVCWACGHNMVKVGAILQSYATAEEEKTIKRKYKEKSNGKT